MAIGNAKKKTLNTCELTKAHNCIACSYESPLETLLLDEFENEVNALISKGFPKRSQKVIRMRYGLGENKDHTYKEIALKLSLSKERIRQIECKVIKKLRMVIKKVDEKILLLVKNCEDCHHFFDSVTCWTCKNKIQFKETILL